MRCTGYSNEHWNNFAEFGWLSVPFDEAVGGFARIEDTALICEQFGRSLVLEPFLANIILAVSGAGGKRFIDPDCTGESAVCLRGLSGKADKISDIKTTATDKGENSSSMGKNPCAKRKCRAT